jgi:hypothetical protein
MNMSIAPVDILRKFLVDKWGIFHLDCFRLLDRKFAREHRRAKQNQNGGYRCDAFGRHISELLKACTK